MSDQVESSAPVSVRSSIGVRALARRAGHARWVETRLFEVLGGWATSVAESTVAARLGVHCHHHAWHADLWRDRVPSIPDVSPDAVSVPPDAAFAAFVDAVASPTDTIERLVGVYRVLVPHVADTYRAFRRTTSATTDGPTARVLDLVLRDLEADVAEGDALIAALLRSADDVQRADAHRSSLERLLASSAGLAGGTAHDASPLP